MSAQLKFDLSKCIDANADIPESLDVAEMATLNEDLDIQSPDLSKWWAVMDRDGIIAYFNSEEAACFFRDAVLKHLRKS